MNSKKIKFTVFADLHYKKGMYISVVDDIDAILDRAHESNSDLVIHLGDLCNDYKGSPELTRAYLENKYGLSAYGIYGNHELESKDNSMELVTSMLCNREVVWGTPSGTIEDGSIGYYHFDISGFRMVCIDTNYSINPETQEYEHNRTASWGEPAGNTRKDSLGGAQLAWLKGVLDDACEKGLHCILFSHTGFSGKWYSSPDTETVKEMIRNANAKRAGTVKMCINGHLHTDHLEMIDGVVYMDVNTARNGFWQGTKNDHYGELTYPYTDHDADGNEIARYDRPLSEASMSKNTWFFESPLSAVITVSADGAITVEGNETKWLYGIEPPNNWNSPIISSGSF